MDFREPAVAGIFYPKQKQALESQLAGFFEKTMPSQKKASAIISPHAGYIYSGKIAAIAFSELKKAQTFVVLGPNHTGRGTPVSISGSDSWKTPLGISKIDSKLREKLLKKLEIEADDFAHFEEHSIEAQIPFIQFLFPEAKILPVCIMESQFGELKKLGNAIAETASEETAIVASSDFSHFVPLENAMEKDFAAIKLIEKLDIEGFYREVTEKSLSICGFGPITAAMQYCRQKSYKGARLLKYDSSATATRDKSSVVGYAAIKFEK